MGKEKGRRGEGTHSGSGGISSNHDDGTDRAELRDDTSGFAAESLVSKLKESALADIRLT